MLSTLFNNLREHSIEHKGIDFTGNLIPIIDLENLRNSEDILYLSSFQELLDFKDTADFAKNNSKARACKKGYPCGASCIATTKNCNKTIDGQAKTYTNWLDLQSKKKAQTPKAKTPKRPRKQTETKKTKAEQERSIKPKFESVDDPQEVNRLLSELMESNVYNAARAWTDVMVARDVYMNTDWTKEAEDKFYKLGVTFTASQSQMDDAMIIMESIVWAGKDQARATSPQNDGKVRVIKTGDKVASAVVYGKEDDAIVVEYLATSLENLTANGGVKGAGTEAMASLVEESIKSGSEGRLRLYPLEGAVPFYKKIGFRNYDPDDDDDSDMVLEPKEAQEFLKRVRG